jgi:hypothetical protein
MPHSFINANYIPEEKSSIIEVVSINKSVIDVVLTDQETM